MSGNRDVSSYTHWVLRAQSADANERRAAFEALARDFQGMVYRVAYSRLQDPQLAEDAAQEAFVTAYQRIAQLRDARAFPAWMRRIALSKADRLKRGRAKLSSPLEDVARLQSAEPSPEAQVEARERSGRLRRAVEALPDSQRDLTRDFYFDGESQREISERLGIPVATVKKRLQYAREQLRRLLSGFNDGWDGALPVELPAREYQPVYIRRRIKR